MPIRIRFRWWWMWVRNIRLCYPYMWRCEKDGCFFMIATNSLEALSDVRLNHMYDKHMPCRNQRNRDCLDFGHCFHGNCLTVLEAMRNI